MIKNFWKLKSFSLFTVQYVYLDHNLRLADRIFRQDNLQVMGQEEYTRQGSPYSAVFCKVFRKDIPRFEKALEKLSDNLLLLEHRDYPEACETFSQVIKAA